MRTSFGHIERCRDSAARTSWTRELRLAFGAVQNAAFGGNSPPGYPPTSVFLVLKLNFLTKIFALSLITGQWQWREQLAASLPQQGFRLSFFFSFAPG